MRAARLNRYWPSSWQREADGKRWRFSLRPQVVFHDGEPLNAANAAPVLLAALKKRSATSP